MRPAAFFASRSDGGEVPDHIEWCISQEEFEAEVDLEQKAGKGHVLKSKHLPVREVILLD